MNPITNMKNLNKMNDRELEMGLAGTKNSWHNQVQMWNEKTEISFHVEIVNSSWRIQSPSSIIFNSKHMIAKSW